MTMGLTEQQIEQFINEGYVKLENAFPEDVAEEGRNILWHDTGCDPGDPATWTKPVIRLGDYAQEPFNKAANTMILHHAFDQLVGKGRWMPRNSLGSFPIRFPGIDAPNDTGWHIDVSFGTNENDFFSWRSKSYFQERGLLMLFLFFDTGEEDAPTRIRIGSHLTMANILFPFGSEGVPLRDLAKNNFDETMECEEVLATGNAGTVYLCHPFLVHAAQAHRGKAPRFM